MNVGWVSIYRELSDSDFWLSERFTKPQAWVDLILMASHKPSIFWIRGIEIKLQRGQLGWSEVTLSKRWKWSRNKVRTFLDWLEKTGKIEQQKKQYITTIITIKNYDKYQLVEQQKKQQTEQQKDSKKYIYNNDNNVNKNNNIPDSKNRVQDKEIKVAERLPENKQLRIHRVVYYLEDETGTRIVNWGKQGIALSKMLKAGYTETEIMKCITHMAKRDEFFSEKGFDLMTVANQISRYKAQTAASLQMRRTKDGK